MSFFSSVYKLVQKIPQGKVATYGQIALLAGSPRAARQVGYALRALGLNEQTIPWWRVVNRDGYLSINHGEAGVEKQVQAEFLRSEGIFVDEKMHLDIEEYLWR